MLAAQGGINDFKQIRLAPVQKRFLPEDAIRSHSREKDWLKKELQAAAGRKIVVVTHHLPSLLSVPGAASAAIILLIFNRRSNS